MCQPVERPQLVLVEHSFFPEEFVLRWVFYYFFFYFLMLRQEQNYYNNNHNIFSTSIFDVRIRAQSSVFFFFFLKKRFFDSIALLGLKEDGIESRHFSSSSSSSVCVSYHINGLVRRWTCTEHRSTCCKQYHVDGSMHAADLLQVDPSFLTAVRHSHISDRPTNADAVLQLN